MITARIQIEDGEILDTYEGWGFIVMGNGDDKKHFAPPEKKRDKTSYAEEAGVHEDPRTVDDEFDYKIQFLVEAPNRNLVNANSRIKAWNDAVRVRKAGSDIKRCKTVTLYDDRMHCKIVGIPEVMAEVGEGAFYRRQDGSAMDCVVATLTIHVSNPKLCDFDLPGSYMTIGNESMPFRYSYRSDVDAVTVLVCTNREVAVDEASGEWAPEDAEPVAICLLARGGSAIQTDFGPNGEAWGMTDYTRVDSGAGRLHFRGRMTGTGAVVELDTAGSEMGRVPGFETLSLNYLSREPLP